MGSGEELQRILTHAFDLSGVFLTKSDCIILSSSRTEGMALTAAAKDIPLTKSQVRRAHSFEIPALHGFEDLRILIKVSDRLLPPSDNPLGLRIDLPLIRDASLYHRRCPVSCRRQPLNYRHSLTCRHTSRWPADSSSPT